MNFHDLLIIVGAVVLISGSAIVGLWLVLMVAGLLLLTIGLIGSVR